MSDTLCELLLARIIAYLEGLDMVITPSLSIRALDLVENALSQPDLDPFTYLMEQIPEQFALPQLELPPLAPPIKRGSIGYNK